MFPKTQKSPERGWKSGLAFGVAKKAEKKTTVRSIDAKTVKAVLERDGFACVLCGSSELDLPHHAYFGLEANRGPDRNPPRATRHDMQGVPLRDTLEGRLGKSGTV